MTKPLLLKGGQSGHAHSTVAPLWEDGSGYMQSDYSLLQRRSVTGIATRPASS